MTSCDSGSQSEKVMFAFPDDADEIWKNEGFSSTFDLTVRSLETSLAWISFSDSSDDCLQQ